MIFLPVHPVAPFFHLAYELFPAGCSLLAGQDGQGDLLYIAFHFSILGLLQEVVSFFIPRNSFFPFLSGKCLSFLRNMKPLLSALQVAPFLQVLQIGATPLELVTILIVYGIDDEVRMYMPFVYMRGYQNFMPCPCLCMFCQLNGVLVRPLRSYFLVLMIAVYEVLIRSAPSLAPQLLCGLHFVLDRFRLAMQTADKFLLCLFFFRHIVQCLPYACL